MNINIIYYPEIIVSILSSPHNYKKRYSFRYNSINICNINTKCRIIFFIGSSKFETINIINKELKLYNDIVKFSFQNSYLNLTLLSVMALKYCYKYFKTFKYYIKTDDDMLINFKLLFKLIKLIDNRKSIVYGHLESKFKPNRNNNSKAYIPYIEYPYEYIPKYAYGGLQIITNTAINLLYNQTLYKQFYVWKEDVNLGILCSLAGINIMQFPYKIDIKLNSHRCDIINNIVAIEIKSHGDSFYCIK